ncbi:MAG: DUF3500 domain-containing protein [Gemmataceae bacterium]|nr:DUF3500 domain-containing protein [Gemmataceae bacterium]
MKLCRFLLAAVLLVSLSGVAYVSQKTASSGQQMANAAKEFLDSLSPAQKKQATFPFDSQERTNWNFVPLENKGVPTRKGVALKDMNEPQRKAALALVAAGTSAKGNQQATTIMSLEAILRELQKAKYPTRDPDWYFFTIFGTPARTGKWGWRVEGHHLSLNFTLEDGKLVSATPFLFGANPALVMAGPRKGLRTLPEAEDLALQLFQSLNEEQKQAAAHAKAFPEPKQKSPTPDVGPPVGLAAAKMTPKQKQVLERLVEAYARRMPQEIGQAELKGVRDAGIDKIHFAFSGGAERGQSHTYRVQGPTFVIEFLNNQRDGAGNPANHIHSCWRRIKGDFGL